MGKYCVYKHTCPNGKVYIGKTCRKPEYRWGSHGERYYTSPYFWNAIQKYGWENIKHEILFDGLAEEEANQKEMEMIAKYNSNNREFGYNITAGGDGSSGVPHSEEWKQRHRELMTGKNNPFYGKYHSEEMKKHWSEMKKGKGGRPVLQIEKESGNILKRYDNMKIASEEMGIDRGSINKCCQGKLRTAGGFIWQYDGE